MATFWIVCLFFWRILFAEHRKYLLQSVSTYNQSEESENWVNAKLKQITSAEWIIVSKCKNNNTHSDQADRMINSLQRRQRHYSARCSWASGAAVTWGPGPLGPDMTDITRWKPKIKRAVFKTQAALGHKRFSCHSKMLLKRIARSASQVCPMAYSPKQEALQ